MCNEMIKDHEAYIEKIEMVIEECYCRLLENKIVVVNNDEVFDNYNSMELDFIGKVDDLNREEDFINSHTQAIVTKHNEFMVIRKIAFKIFYLSLSSLQSPT